MLVDDECRQIRKDLFIAEYNAVRAAADQKASAAQSAIAAYFTLTTAIVGFVISTRNDIRLLLAVPIFSAAFGITALDRYGSREVARQYIRDVLRPIAIELGEDTRLLGWDDYYAGARRENSVTSRFGINFLIPFVSIASLALTAPTLKSLADWVAWSVGAAFSGALIAYGTRTGGKLHQALRDALRRLPHARR